jgi:hypothetical protein
LIGASNSPDITVAQKEGVEFKELVFEDSCRAQLPFVDGMFSFFYNASFGTQLTLLMNFFRNWGYVSTGNGVGLHQ